MTTLTITPDIAKKKLKLSGTVASGEKVAVTIVGFGTMPVENLRLRVMVGSVTVGYFPLEDEDAFQRGNLRITPRAARHGAEPRHHAGADRLAAARRNASRRSG